MKKFSKEEASKLKEKAQKLFARKKYVKGYAIRKTHDTYTLYITLSKECPKNYLPLDIDGLEIITKVVGTIKKQLVTG